MISEVDADNIPRNQRVETSAAPDRPERPYPSPLSSNSAGFEHQLIWTGAIRLSEVSQQLPGPLIQSAQLSKRPGK